MTAPGPQAPLRVVAAVIMRGDEVLVQQRAPGKARALLWELPGGKVEAGESDAVALTRELHEELGVDVTVGERLDSNQHAYDDLHIELTLYRAEVTSDAQPRAHDAHLVAWVLRTALGDLEFSAADLPFVERLRVGDY